MGSKLTLDPQNPYESFMVEASAGTGKTYQLTRRFLLLVGAGADPSQILAITFTVKAVGEMQARIIAEAGELLVNKQYQRSFEKKLKEFYQEISQEKTEPFRLPPPRTALETAHLILTSTQSLKICTIDSIFYEWVMRFPAESSPENYKNDSFLRSLNLTETYENEKISQSAWDSLLRNEGKRNSFDESFQSIRKFFPSLGLLGIQKQVEELYRYRLHVFHQGSSSQDVFKQFRLNETEAFHKKSSEEIILGLRSELQTLAMKTSKSEILLQGIQKNNFDFLVKQRLLTKAGLVSKTLLRGKKRDELAPTIQKVEAILNRFHLEKSKHRLNSVGSALFQIYDLWNQERDLIKKNQKICDFSDLSIGCHNLFSREENSSVLWLLQKSIHHILVDEFQDTSMVQWDIFSNLIREILSAFESSTDEKNFKTAFVVGDRKQSIYGFREADPYVMDLSSDFFSHFRKGLVSLNRSYRSAPLVMDFLSRFFSEKIDSTFPLHETGVMPSGNLAVPNVSRIVVSDLIEKDDSILKTPLEREAEQLVSYLEKVFENPEGYPVFDKSIGGFRKIKYSDVCVLYRNATHVETFTKALSERNIPFHRDGESNFFETPGIEALLSLLRFLVDPSDLLSLVNFLSSDLFHLSENVILRALELSKSYDKDERSEEFLKALEGDVNLESLSFLRGGAFSLLPHEVLKKAYALMILPEDLKKRSLLQKSLIGFLDLVLSLEKKSCLSLHACLEEIEKISSSYSHHTDDDFLDSVLFMTIHKSKGLEFPFVCLIEASDSWFKFDRYWIKSHDGMYYCGTHEGMPHEDLDFQGVYRDAAKSFYEETIRLLYVALTRSSQYLFISAHSSRGTQKDSFHEKLIQFIKQSCSGALEQDGYFFLQEGFNPLPDLISPSVSSQREALSLEYEPTGEGRDLKILNPHETLSVKEPYASSSEKSSKLNDDVASLFGTFIHKVFEYTLSHTDFCFDGLWKKMISFSPVFMRRNFPEDSQRLLKNQVKDEIKKNLENPEFKKLIKKAVEIKCEYDVVCLQSHTLLKGSIDLFLRFEDKKILILDFKSSSVPDTLASLEVFCREKGYGRQLEAYARALRELYPGYRIEKGVFLTKKASIVLMS